MGPAQRAEVQIQLRDAPVRNASPFHVRPKKKRKKRTKKKKADDRDENIHRFTFFFFFHHLCPLLTGFCSLTAIAASPCFAPTAPVRLAAAHMPPAGSCLMSKAARLWHHSVAISQTIDEWGPRVSLVCDRGPAARAQDENWLPPPSNPPTPPHHSYSKKSPAAPPRLPCDSPERTSVAAPDLCPPPSPVHRPPSNLFIFIPPYSKIPTCSFSSAEAAALECRGGGFGNVTGVFSRGFARPLLTTAT